MYGQTSSGKTHTMMGTSDDPGIIPLTIHEVFSYIEQVGSVCAQSNLQMSVAISPSCAAVCIKGVHSQTLVSGNL